MSRTTRTTQVITRYFGHWPQTKIAPKISSEVSEWPGIFYPKDLDFKVADSMRDFHQKLFLKLSNVEKGNFVFSPVSLHMTLTILALGAPFRSKTRNELVSKFSYLYFYILACE